MGLTEQTIVIPGYRQIREIGRGSYGVVWLGRETASEAFRAIKFLKEPDPNSVGVNQSATNLGRTIETVEREVSCIGEYRKEAQGHSGIIQIEHLSEAGGRFYYIMELADDARTGQPLVENDASTYEPFTLKHMMKRDGLIVPSRALEIIEQILVALQHLHSHGRKHRDIKPDNILFVQGSPKIGDLGLVTDDPKAALLGTRGYYPDTGQPDEQADIYATGTMLYEMVTGHDRSEHPNPLDVMPPSRHEQRAAQTAMKIVSKTRRRALSDAGEALNIIKDWRTGRLWRRRAAMVASVALLLVIAITVSWQRLTHLSRATPKEPLAVVPRAISAQIDKDAPIQNANQPRPLEVVYDNGSKKLTMFSTLATSAVVGSFWPGKTSVAVGFTAHGPLAGRLAVYDADELWTSSSPKATVEQRICESPPSQWEIKEGLSSCRVVAQFAANLDGLPGDELVVTSDHDDGCSELLIVKHGGEILGRFWHRGWIWTVRPVDLDSQPALVCLASATRQPNRRSISLPVEPDVKCLFTLSLNSLMGATGHWGFQDWMREGSKITPLAYGYHKTSCGECKWEAIGDYGETVIRITLKPDSSLYLDLRGDLTPIKTGYFSNVSSNSLPPDLHDVWVRTWPLDEKSEKDHGSSGK